MFMNYYWRMVSIFNNTELFNDSSSNSRHSKFWIKFIRILNKKFIASIFGWRNINLVSVRRPHTLVHATVAVRTAIIYFVSESMHYSWTNPSSFIRARIWNFLVNPSVVSILIADAEMVELVGGQSGRKLVSFSLWPIGAKPDGSKHPGSLPYGTSSISSKIGEINSGGFLIWIFWGILSFFNFKPRGKWISNKKDYIGHYSHEVFRCEYGKHFPKFRGRLL